MNRDAGTPDNEQMAISDPPDTVAFVHRTIAEGEKPVLTFGRYPDGSLCAYTGVAVVDAEREFACVCLSHIVDVEPAVGELADIPPGWWAVRETASSPWVREQIPPEEL